MAALHLSSPRQSELRSSSVSLQDEVPFDPKVGFFLHSPLDPETTSCRALGNLGWFSYRVSAGYSTPLAPPASANTEAMIGEARLVPPTGTQLGAPSVGLSGVES